MKIAKLLVCSLFGLALTVSHASAERLDQTFANDFNTSSIYLWADDPLNLEFDRVRFGQNMGDWTVQSNSGEALVLAGTTVAAGAGRFSLRLDYVTRPFSLQWAEVFFDSGLNVIQGAGTLRYSGSAWTASNVFTRGADMPNQFASSSAVPLPGSIVLLLSSLLCMPLRSLHRWAAAV